jgi:hypothetical protein
MTRPQAAELIGLQDELQRLLTLGQPPAVAVEMRRRFVEATLPLGPAIWAGFTFQVAIALVRQIPSLTLLGLSPQAIDALRDLIRRIRTQPVPAWSGAVNWPDLCEHALAELDRTEPAIAEGEIGVPVVAKACGNGATHPIFEDVSVGCILRLRVDADVADRRRRIPQLVVDGEAAVDTRSAFEATLGAVGAARAWGAPHPSRCVFRASWDMPGARLVGRSGGLAFFLAAATARARLSPSLWDRILPEGLAATGDVESNTVLPVDPDGLLTKVRASHHARVKILLVPRAQEEAAAKEARSMESIAPGHRVQIVGVDDVRQVWASDSVVRRRARRLPLFVHGLLSWLTRSPIRIALLLAVFTAIVGALIFTAVRWEREPVAAEWKGERLVMRNRYGHAWSIPVLYPPAPHVFFQPDWGAPLVVLKPPGSERSIVIAILGAGPQGSERLVALTPDGDILWEMDSRRIGEHHHTPVADVGWSGIYFPGPAADGSERIYALRRSIQSNLCLIDRVDAGSGASRGCLRNQGHLEFSREIDLDNDGVREVVFMGTHNPDSCAIAIVLEPDRMRPISSADSLDSIPNVSHPSSLGSGVAACWRFANDRFSTQLRSTCNGLYEDSVGIVRIATSGSTSEGSFLYRLRTADLHRPAVLDVQMTDAYRAYHNERMGRAVPAAEIAAEESRLAGKAAVLTDGGWVPMRRTVARFSESDPEVN